MAETRITGGCLCGALRYEVSGEPGSAGFCFCRDCQRASGSGFIPFMNFPAETVRIAGPSVANEATSARGTPAHRNRCPDCGSLVFGGVRGTSAWHTIYAGTLDDPADFVPQMAIFGRDRPSW